jgi:aminoglycoside phosphotransferase (APT) family kinase protein
MEFAVTSMKMHEQEVDIDEKLIRVLLSRQFNEWARLPVKRVSSDGTDNIIYKLGEDKCLRIPRIPKVNEQLIEKQNCLNFLAPHLPIEIPSILKIGTPEDCYPGHFTVYRWHDGLNLNDSINIDLHQLAIDLARFINCLCKINSTNGPDSRRGCPLYLIDDPTREAISSLEGIIDTKKAVKVWDICLKASLWNKAPVWIHSDLLPGNILIKEGRISAVIDFDMLGIGDPACDLLPAWSIFNKETRKKFRDSLEIDHSTWVRGRGWALSIGLIILPYYLHTNPGLVKIGKRLVNEAIEDSE